ncbi:MAG: YjbQ family protein [Calditrichaeota bacterium]|nr:YjbQ family protein [Calditrichota bacterium]
MVKLDIRTKSRTELVDITQLVQKTVSEQNVQNGLAVIFVPHTTAAVTINENADPTVQRDILYEINKVIPFEDNYRHYEGNSAAHIKASLFGSSETVIVENGYLQLGTWQGIYFCEFDGPRHRKVWIQIIKE